MRRLLVLLALGLPLAGCSGAARPAYERELAGARPGERHAIHSERLAEVMRALDRLAPQRLPQDLDLESARDPLVDELVEVAAAIARTAEQIPEAAFGSGTMTQHERVAFHQRAALLRERALALARDAETMSPRERTDAVAELREVCDGCHAEFRDPRRNDGR